MPATLQQHSVLRIPALPHARHQDRGLPLDHALIRADTATYTKFQIDPRLLHNYLLAFVRSYLRFLEPDGLLRRGTMLFANDARPRAGVRQAPVAVDVRQPDLDLLLLIHGKWPDGAGGADLGA